MCRGIKFRVWDENANDWLHDAIKKETVFGCDSGFKWNSDRGFATLHQNRDHLEYILEQYTGLKDKNGAKIYEGDIVCFEGEDLFSVVVFSKGAFRLKSNLGTGCPIAELEPLVIVGNIHENPEFLDSRVQGAKKEENNE